MRILLALLLSCLGLHAASPILRNQATTNADPYAAITFPASAGVYPNTTQLGTNVSTVLLSILSDSSQTNTLEYSGATGAAKLAADMELRRLYRSNGSSYLVDWENGLLIYTTTSLDWQNRIAYDLGLTKSLDYQNRVLFNASGGTNIDYRLSLLKDTSNLKSVDYNTRFLYTSTGANRFNWESGILYGGGNEIINLEDGHLSPPSGSAYAIALNSYVLHSSSGDVLNWASQETSDTGGDVSINWNSRLLKDGGGVTTSFDWDGRVAYDASGVASLSYAARTLKDASGNTTLNWDAKTFSTGWTFPATVVTNASTLTTALLVGNGVRGVANTAVGAVPIDGDGTATTFAQINSLAPANVITQSTTFRYTNTVGINSTNSALSGTTLNGPTTNKNIAASSLSGVDANQVATNIVVGTGLSLSGGVLSAALKTNVILTFNLGNGGAVIPTGTIQGFPPAGDNWTISGWSITAMGTSPTCTIDIWKIASGTALPTVANTIMGTKPALATGNAIISTTLTSWNTAVVKGDIWGGNVDACANATNIVVELFGYR